MVRPVSRTGFLPAGAASGSDQEDRRDSREFSPVPRAQEQLSVPARIAHFYLATFTLHPPVWKNLCVARRSRLHRHRRLCRRRRRRHLISSRNHLASFLLSSFFSLLYIFFSPRPLTAYSLGPSFPLCVTVNHERTTRQIGDWRSRRREERERASEVAVGGKEMRSVERRGNKGRRPKRNEEGPEESRRKKEGRLRLPSRLIFPSSPSLLVPASYNLFALPFQTPGKEITWDIGSTIRNDRSN